ncbi:MAG: accessory Sec system protein Asp2 [Lachnospiraceae bacterium]|nr:accessory Sec system protein Asp2 [Lachnospiraceae bacterium]
MGEQIQVLQTGDENWEEKYSIPQEISWHYINLNTQLPSEKEEGRTFDVVLLEGEVNPDRLSFLRKAGRPYTYFLTENLVMTGVLKRLLADKKARKIRVQDIQQFIERIPFAYYPGQEGRKIGIREMEISKPFVSNAEYDGNRAVRLSIDTEGRNRQVLFLKYNISFNIYAERGMELWPEYSAEGSIALQFKIKLFKRGMADELLWSRTAEEKDFEKPLRISEKDAGYLTVQILARGAGRLEIGPFHFRSSRAGAGQFLPGGQRHAARDRGEVLSYFDPGDRKPPLIVYFSGYRTAEGFEGNGIMRGLGTPFLLLGDPRLEGGGFYLGERDYEEKIVSIIRDTMNSLRFDSNQLILSGLSMGTFGAVYYGCTLSPHAIVIGKPLMNLGTVAANERRLRPGGFPTSLDVLRMATGGIGTEQEDMLNRRLWNKFDLADFKDTIFSVAYMFQDDYDSGAYQDILTHLEEKGISIVGKGLEGRHNDNTAGIVSWFLSQLRRILRQDFYREVS